jgi:hypothetical protein
MSIQPTTRFKRVELYLANQKIANVALGIMGQPLQVTMWHITTVTVKQGLKYDKIVGINLNNEPIDIDTETWTPKLKHVQRWNGPRVSKSR